MAPLIEAAVGSGEGTPSLLNLLRLLGNLKVRSRELLEASAVPTRAPVAMRPAATVA